MQGMGEEFEESLQFGWHCHHQRREWATHQPTTHVVTTVGGCGGGRNVGDGGPQHTAFVVPIEGARVYSMGVGGRGGGRAWYVVAFGYILKFEEVGH